MDSKICKRCGVDKPFEEFYKWARSKDGRADWCKACRSSHDKSVSARTRQRFALWYAEPANKELCKQQRRKWKASNPERLKISRDAYNRSRRARLANVENTLTKEQWQEVLEDFGHLCAYCSAPAEVMDHIYPIVLGGANSQWNVVPACKACNLSKNAKPLDRWLNGNPLQV